MSENTNPSSATPELPPIEPGSPSIASNSLPVALKSPTIAEIITRATVELDGLGLNDSLRREAEILCEAEMTRIAAFSLHTVVSKHISQLVPTKPTRKPRKSADDTQVVS